MSYPPKNFYDKSGLADQCFGSQVPRDILHEEILEIVGHKRDSPEKSPIVAIAFSKQDRSLDVVLGTWALPLIREQADQLLKMGFSRVFETRASIGRMWLPDSSIEVSPREVFNDLVAVVASEAKVRDLKKLLTSLQNVIVDRMIEMDLTEVQKRVLKDEVSKSQAKLSELTSL